MNPYESKFITKLTNFFIDRDKKKEFAQNCAAYYPIGADVFLSQRKIDHIARFVELPAINPAGDVPSILVVNVQVSILFIMHSLLLRIINVCSVQASFYLLTFLDNEIIFLDVFHWF